MSGDGPVCPIPAMRYDRIVMGHGSGGTLARELLAGLFLPELGNGILGALEDAATLPLRTEGGGRVAISTDGYVVQPPFFPGGDIGRLAVCGTTNDLAVSGAVPLYLAGAFILEEGLPMADLQRIVASMRETCAEVGVTFAAGDTKVVDRGKGDRIFIVTTGIGIVPPSRSLSISSARPGDKILLSGTLADHGIAVMAAREGIELDTELVSDCAPIADLARVVLERCPHVRCMRDPTRGGAAATLHEIAAASRAAIRIREASLPVRPEVRAACELLGLDALHVANEGKLVAVVPPEHADDLLAALRSHPRGRDAEIIGEVIAGEPATVVLTTTLGVTRHVTLPASEQLPRIC